MAIVSMFCLNFSKGCCLPGPLVRIGVCVYVFTIGDSGLWISLASGSGYMRQKENFRDSPSHLLDFKVPSWSAFIPLPFSLLESFKLYLMEEVGESIFTSLYQKEKFHF